MGLIIPLAFEYDGDSLARSLDAAPRHRRLRDAVPDVISAIHGLPSAMNAELSQIEVYVGRAGAKVPLLRGRWSARFEAFERAPSTVAVVAVRAPTMLVQGERWERTAHLLINALTRNRALCCANALTGDSGRWADTEDCAIYVVARRRRGPAGSGVPAQALHEAVVELLHDDNLDADVVRAASREILNSERGAVHDVFEAVDSTVDDSSTPDYLVEIVEFERRVTRCRRDGCINRPLAGNYGFCGRHRPYAPPGVAVCKECGRRALPGNYGFCGLHRR